MKKRYSGPWKLAALATALMAIGCANARTAPRGVDVSTDYSAVIGPLLDSLSGPSFDQSIRDLCAIPNRVTGRPGCNEARDLLVRRLRGFGWNVSTTAYDALATTAYNVVAEWPGTDVDSRAVVVSAHYDSWGEGNTGAVDNASGSAGLVAIAQCVSSASARFHRTIRLIAFSGEEESRFGSKDYLNTTERSRILAVVNLDAIAPRPTDRGSVLCYYKRYNDDMKTRWLPETLYAVTARYAAMTGIGFATYWNGGPYSYDSDPFEAAGIPAITITGLGEDHANTPFDTMDKVDFDYGRRVIRLAAAAAFTLAGPVMRR